MRARDTPEVAVFRAELREWLRHNLDDDVRGLAGRGLAVEKDHLEGLRAWQRRLDDAGYSAISWPVEHGGRGAGALEQAAYAEELHDARAPGTLNPIGMANIAPSIMQWGTPGQQQRWLPRMRRGDDIWCQGFSEPGAGSDLAGLSTRATRDGDEFVVTGQKVWTSLGTVADWCELLVRTTPLDQAPKHQGLSVLVVDLHSPGVTVRPLRTLTGDHEFSEVFLDEVRVPVGSLLGPQDAGWRVAMTTLNHERAGVLSLALGSRRSVDELIALAHQRDRVDDPGARVALAHAWLGAELLGLLAEQTIAATAAGRPVGAGASLGKLVWADSDESTCRAAEVVLGPDAAEGEWGRRRVNLRSLSIAGGTTQINKNVVATQVLGLPRR